MALTNDQIKRYSRHLIIPDVGVEGQEKLLAAKVLLIGSGGLGSPLALYLAAAGVGRLGLVDFDVVDFSNLQRQIIHTTQDVGRPKLESAKEKINAINPDVKVVGYPVRLSSENALDIVKDYDIVVDGTDNFPTRYLVNDACVLLKKPNVYGSIFRFEGQASVFWAEKGPCYRCLYPEPPPPGMVPSCAEGGVLGILPGIIGVIQATEAIKLLLEKGDLLVGRLLLFDALKMRFREVKLKKDPACPLCGKNPTVTNLIDYEAFCGIRGQEEPAGATVASDGVTEVEPAEVKALMDKKDRLFILDVREPQEYQICHIPDAHLIPLGELAGRVHELDSSERIFVHCHHGPRAHRAIQFLQSAGFRKVAHIRGGIDAWAEEVDPTMPRY